MPASLEKLALEKLALEKLKSSKLLSASWRIVKQGVFLRFSHLFFGSPDKVGRPRDLQNLTARFADNHIKIKVTKRGLFISAKGVKALNLFMLFEALSKKVTNIQSSLIFK